MANIFSTFRLYNPLVWPSVTVAGLEGWRLLSKIKKGSFCGFVLVKNAKILIFTHKPSPKPTMVTLRHSSGPYKQKLALFFRIFLLESVIFPFEPFYFLKISHFHLMKAEVTGVVN